MKILIKIFIITFLCFLINVKTVRGCNTVAEMPDDMSKLLPFYDFIPRIHLRYNFYADDYSLRFTTKGTKTIKISVESVHSNIEWELQDEKTNKIIFINSNNKLDYSNVNLHEGSFLIKTVKKPLNTSFDTEFAVSKNIDEICDRPYFKFEFYLEDSSQLEKRIKGIKMKTSSFPNFDDFFLFDENIVTSIPFKQALKPFSLRYKEDHKLGIKTDYSVLRMYFVNVPEEKKLIQFKLNILVDFLLGGSLKLILLKKEDFIDSKLKECLEKSQEHCIISKKINKSNINLSTILTYGEYYLVIIDHQNRETFNYFRSNLNYLPLSVDLEVTDYRPNESRFSCFGRRLPNGLFILQNQDNFKLEGDYIINLRDPNFKHSIEFKTRRNSVLNLITLQGEGEQIHIKLYKEDNQEFTFIDESYSQENHSALLVSLFPNNKYRLTFDFSQSIFTQTEINNLNACPTFKMKLNINSSVNLINSISQDDCGEDKNKLNAFIDNFTNNLEKFIYNKKDGFQSESEVFHLNSNNFETMSELYTKQFTLNSNNHFILYAEISSPLNLVVSINDKRDLISSNNSVHDYITKGIHKISIMNNISQFASNKENKNYSYDTKRLLPKCIYFTIKLSLIELSSKKTKTWPCKNEEFDVLPYSINLENSRYNYNYYTNNGLITPVGSQHIINIKTTDDKGHLLKFLYQSEDNIKVTFHFREGNNLIPLNDSNSIFLKPNSKYKLEIQTSNQFEYYQKCYKMKFKMSVTPYVFLEQLKQCENVKDVPPIENVFVERIVGKENSYFKYDSKKITEIFLSSDEKSTKELKEDSNIISYKRNKIMKKFSHSYNFVIKSYMARVSVIIEAQGINKLIALSAIIKKKGEEENILEKTQMENENRFTIKGLTLTFGEYVLEISDDDILDEYLDDLCVKFSLRVIIENLPYDSESKLEKSSNVCHLLPMPKDFNSPGLFCIDTNYTLSDTFKFKLATKNTFKISLKQYSYINILLPNENSNLFSHFNIESISNGENKIILKSERKNIYTELAKGIYLIGVYYDGGSLNNECNALEIKITIIAHQQYKTDSQKICSDFSTHFISQIFPNTERNYEVINIKLDKNNLYYFEIQPISKSNLQTGGKFLGKLVGNNYINSGFEIKVYQPENNNKNSLTSEKDFDENPNLSEVSTKINYFENYIWIMFNVEKDTVYYLRFIPLNKKLGECSVNSFSFIYEELQRESGLADFTSIIEKEEERKKLCEVNEYLGKSIEYTSDDEINFYGEFLFPKGVNHVRTTLNVKEKSIFYLKILNHPKKSNQIHLNAYIEIFQSNNFRQRVAHSDSQSELMVELDSLNNEVTEYTISVLFEDRQGDINECSTYEIVLNLIQFEKYPPKLCNMVIDEHNKLQSTNNLILLKDKGTTFYNFETHFRMSESVFQYNTETKEYEYEFNIQIENASKKLLNLLFEIHLEYFTGQNSIDLGLYNRENILLERSKENINLQHRLKGVTEEKYLSVNLQSSSSNLNHKLKLHFSKSFKVYIENIFDDEIENKIIKDFCFPFNLKMVLITYSDDENKDTANSILLVNPPGDLIRVNLNKKYYIEIEFRKEMDIDLTLNNQMVYLYESSSNNSSNKVFPDNIFKISEKRINIEFNTKDLKDKCYKLGFYLGKDFKAYDNVYEYCTTDRRKIQKNKIIKEEIAEDECENGLSLPENLFQEKNSYLGAMQNKDGSIDVNTYVLSENKIKEEYVELMISERSIIKVLYKEVNRSFENIHKLYLISSKDDEYAIASLDEDSKMTAFLEPRQLPYIIKIIHVITNSEFNANLKCSQFLFRINIKPFTEVIDLLECSNLVMGNLNNIQSIQDSFLPDSNIFLGDGPLNEIILHGKSFVFIDSNHEHEIAIKVVKNQVYMAATLSHSFISDDISLVLKTSKNDILSRSHFLANQNTNVVYSLEHTLQAHTEYKLVIQRNQMTKHLFKNIFKNHFNCFKFNFHIQTSVIRSEVNEKYSNRIILVQPEAKLNMRSDRKLEILIEFENKLSVVEIENMFSLKNTLKNEIINPNKVKINPDKKSVSITFNQNSLQSGSCYELDYKLGRDILADENITHKYCSVTCNCNANSEFECDHNGQCMCLSPYTGEGCNKCISGFVMIDGVCLSEENCREKECSSKGNCLNGECKCDEGFKGLNCSECQDDKKVFPNCNKKLKDVQHQQIHELKKEEKVYLHQESIEACDHPFVPMNLDTLGYLKTDGNMHISGLYSLKHFSSEKQYQMTLTIKQTSHFKIYFEHTRSNYNINLYLTKYADQNEVLAYSTSIYGPGGSNTATLINIDTLSPNLSTEKINLPYYLTIEISDLEKNNLQANECFIIFMELQIMKKEELAFESNKSCKDDLPNLFLPLDKTPLDKKELSLSPSGLTRHSFNFKGVTNSEEKVHYFHSEYFYVPDYLEEEIILHLEIYSKFLSEHIGVLIEVLTIPNKIDNVRVDHKKMTPAILKTNHSNQKIISPQCTTNRCFTGVKKYNAFVLSRVFPRDTFIKLWYYAVPSNPRNEGCLIFDKNFELKRKTISTTATISANEPNKITEQICTSSLLPSSLNIKGFLGDVTYLQKWGFHVLDSFNINHALNLGFTHTTEFTISEYYLLRLKIENTHVELDVELYFKRKSGPDFMLTSTHKESNEIAIEIPPGDYKLFFKFYVNNFNYAVCQDFKMEFSLKKTTQVQDNVNRLNEKHTNNPVFKEINLYDLLSFPSYDITTEIDNFLVPVKRAVNISNPDNMFKLETISSLEFEIDSKSSNKVELFASTSSDFLLFNAEFVLIENSSQKIIFSSFKKNTNMLKTSPLETGVYTLLLRYHPRMHFTDKEASLESVSLKNINFMELEVKIFFLNKSTDLKEIKSEQGIVKVAYFPHKNNAWILECNNEVIPLPQTLNTLRYLEFNSDMHILESYLVPRHKYKHLINFRVNLIEKMMFRVYIECFNTDIDIQLYEVDSSEENKNKLIAESNSSTIFETIMQIIQGDKDYQLVLLFNHSHVRKNNNCISFKMEIAAEVSHSFACPENNAKYAKLDSLNVVPKILPESVNFKYDSRNIFKGESFDSGYLYLLRNKHDVQLKFAEFSSQEEVDIKIEIINDFIQAPINPFVTKSKNLKDNDDNIIAYGEMFENRNVLFIQSLPAGSYSVFFYVPGLKTLFEHEKTVCSMYDLVIEIRKSRYSVKYESLIQSESVLDIPTALPLYLNYRQFLEGYESNSLIYKNTFFWRNVNDNSDKDGIANNIQFTLNKDSDVIFEVEDQNISLQLDDAKDNKQRRIIKHKLNKGKHNLALTRNKNDLNKFDVNSLRNTFTLLFAISDLDIKTNIMQYNNIKECIATKIPTQLNYDKQNKLFVYKNMLINANPLNGKFTHSFKEINLSSALNRMYIELGFNLLAYKMSVKLKSERNEWLPISTNNVQIIDTIVPKGVYEIIVQGEENFANEQKCVLFNLDISIYNLQHFNKSHLDSGNILPREIFLKDSNVFINLNLNKVIFNKALNYNNKISLTMKEKSLMRVVTTPNSSSKVSMLPKLMNKNFEVKEIKKSVNYKFSENNLLWFLDSDYNNYYLQFITIKQLQLDENFKNLAYNLNIQIDSVNNLNTILQCPSDIEINESKYKIPKSSINLNDGRYADKIKFSFFTPSIYRNSFTEDDDEFSYKIKLDFNNNFEEEFEINAEIGYLYLISSFSVELVETSLNNDSDANAFKTRLVETSQNFINDSNENNNFSHKAFFNTLLRVRKNTEYHLIIKENSWRLVQNFLLVESDVNLCLPFDFSINVIPVNSVDLKPEIISIVSEGLSDIEDWKIRIILSKTPYTMDKEKITGNKNYFNMINAFYLKDQSNSLPYKIHPDKVEEISEQEWVLIFFSSHLSSHVEYQLLYDTEQNWLFDNKKNLFISSNEKLLVRGAQKDFNINNLAKKMEKMRSKSESNNENKNISKKTDITKPKNKCGEHGKLIKDQILNKYICTCLDGYIGKSCELCMGQEQIIINKKVCIFKSEFEIEDEEEYQKLNENIVIKNKACICINGTCDKLSGYCICYPNYIGLKCEKLVNSNVYSSKQDDTNNKTSSLILILTLSLFIFIITYVYKKIRNSDSYLFAADGEESKYNNYTPVSSSLNESSEFEMAFAKDMHSINLELSENSIIE